MGFLAFILLFGTNFGLSLIYQDHFRHYSSALAKSYSRSLWMPPKAMTMSLFRRVIGQSNGNFVGFQRLTLKMVKNYHMYEAHRVKK